MKVKLILLIVFMLSSLNLFAKSDEEIKYLKGIKSIFTYIDIDEQSQINGISSKYLKNIIETELRRFNINVIDSIENETNTLMFVLSLRSMKIMEYESYIFSYELKGFQNIIIDEKYKKNRNLFTNKMFVPIWFYSNIGYYGKKTYESIYDWIKEPLIEFINDLLKANK